MRADWGLGDRLPDTGRLREEDGGMVAYEEEWDCKGGHEYEGSDRLTRRNNGLEG